jgi:hypothetical protein
MAIADWTATVVVVWLTFVVALVTSSVLVGLIIGRVLKFRDQQVPAIDPGKVAEPAPGKRTARTAVWRSTVTADGHVHHRQVA